MSFVHLHTHSHYSLLDGLSKIPDLVHAVKARGMNAIALTDHGNLYGAIEFYEEAIREGIKPIIGIEAYMAPKGIETREAHERPTHIILLAENNNGYENLIQLTTQAHLEGFYGKPRIDFSLLERYSKGLIVLSGCLSGEIPRAIREKGVDEAEKIAQRYLTVFDSEHFYLEVQHNPNTPEQQVVNNGLRQLHERLNIEFVATNDSHYINPEDSEAQDILLCIQTKTLLADDRRLTMRTEDYALKTAKEMKELFREYPRAVENTVAIAERVHVDIELGKIQLPYYQLPPNITPEDALRELCTAGVQRRYATVTDEIHQRLEYELDVIHKTGFASYFLIVADFITWAKREGIAVGPGRGSAAGSLVSYLTGITDIDPIRYELLFERFLNPERVSQPDIDTDFADSRRDDVLKYVGQKYGSDHVAQIVTFGTMAARAAVRDVGRVLGFSYGYCDRISKMIPMFTSLDEAVRTVPELNELVAQDPDAERLMQIAKKLEGVARHTSTHACAVVITKNPLTTQVPLQRDQEGAIISQYSMHPIEHLGLLKMDFLGLKNLTIIEHSLNIIRATTGITNSIEDIPLDDKKTFQLLQRAETVGIFQLESSGMRRYLKQLKPTDMEDIIAMVSLYRPGPMDFIPDFIAGKHGKKEISYIEPRLEPILKKTYGIAVYQEQIMEIARQLAGYTYGEADVLRKAVGKKIKSLLDEQEQKMISGMVKNTISPGVAKKIWEFILPFARYGFNRSHAACYAMIAYRTAYLKANYPAQFMAALLTADYGDTERIAIEVAHAEQCGLEVLPPDINESFGTFTVVKESLHDEHKPRIRFGLKAIKNVGDHIVDVISAERKANGPFRTVEEVLTRIHDKDLNKKSLESLIKAGALDSLGDRNVLLFNCETLLQFARRAQEERNSGQTNLFSINGAAPRTTLQLEPCPPMDRRTQLQWEKELMGLYVSGHPLAMYRSYLERHSIPFNTLRDYPKKRKVTIIGMVSSSKRVNTKNGDPMLFVQFEDHTAEIELIVFPKVYEQHRTFWDADAILRVIGKCDDADGQIKVIVDTVERLSPDVLKQSQEQSIVITVPTRVKKDLFEQFKQTLDAAPKGTFHVYLSTEGKNIDTHCTVDVSLTPVLRDLFGHDAVSVIQ